MTDFFRAVEFVGSFPDIKSCPDSERIPLVAFTGRSNSGKSSLLSAICDHHNLAKVSRTAGKTRLLNYFKVPPFSNFPDGLYLVDMPGYGFAQISHGEKKRLRIMVDDFLLKAVNLDLIIVVLDARRSPGAEELGIIKYCQETNKTILMARTKWDRMNMKARTGAQKSWRNQGIGDICCPVSSPQKKGLDKIIDVIKNHRTE